MSEIEPSVPQPRVHVIGPPRVRWGLLAAILLVGTGLLALVLSPVFRDAGIRNMALQSLMALMAGLVFVWSVLLSGFSAGVRQRIFWSAVAVALLGVATLRFEGVTGDLWVDLGWRWKGRGPLAADARAAPGKSQPIALATSPRDFPRFLGPQGNASLPDVHLATDWNRQPPRELWRRPVGAGWSGFAVVGDFAFTQELRGEREAVTCYALQTGEPQWTFEDTASASLGGKVAAIGGDGPRATPTIVEGKLYALSATGNLNSLDAQTGVRLWSHQILEESHAEPVPWGQSNSPLVADGLVIIPAGGKEQRSLLAYRVADGSLAWSGGDDGASYATPVLGTLAGVRQVVCVHRNTISGHALDDGHVLWSLPWENPEPNVANPLLLPLDRLFVSAGYDWGGALWRFQPGDNGAFRTEELWRNKFLKAKFTNVVYWDGHLYGLDDKILTCLDVVSGVRKWKGGRYGHGQVLLVGQTLLVQGEGGEVALVAADPAGYQELARIEALSDKTWNNPALAVPYLLVRNDREAICYELPLAERTAAR